jgi:hypothetical protein
MGLQPLLAIFLQQHQQCYYSYRKGMALVAPDHNKSTPIARFFVLLP